MIGGGAGEARGPVDGGNSGDDLSDLKDAIHSKNWA